MRRWRGNPPRPRSVSSQSQISLPPHCSSDSLHLMCRRRSCEPQLGLVQEAHGGVHRAVSGSLERGHRRGGQVKGLDAQPERLYAEPFEPCRGTLRTVKGRERRPVCKKAIAPSVSSAAPISHLRNLGYFSAPSYRSVWSLPRRGRGYGEDVSDTCRGKQNFLPCSGDINQLDLAFLPQ